jgi:hypothetical protein
MLHLKKFNWTLLITGAADWLSMIILLVYAFHPSLESSLKMIYLFYSLIFSMLGYTAVSSAYQLVLYCRKSRPNRQIILA